MPTPFADGCDGLISLGFHVLPIMPGSKAPGYFTGGRWGPLRDWPRYRDKLPTQFELRVWRTWPDAGIGLVFGTPAGDGLVVVGVDIDTDEHVELIASALPYTPMAKRGAKGRTLIYRAPAALRSRAYRISKKTIVDLLTGNQTRQTVLPPSVHPDIGAAYTWQGQPVASEELPILDEAAIERLEDTLSHLGWSDEAPAVERAPTTPADPGEVTIWRDVNDQAMADMAAWVPHLGLYGLRAVRRGGYEAVATWRDSSTGRPLQDRKRNLKIHPDGIRDFGTDETFTPIDLVMRARGLAETGPAYEWLQSRFGGAAEPMLIEAPRKTMTAPDGTMADAETGEVIETELAGAAEEIGRRFSVSATNGPPATTQEIGPPADPNDLATPFRWQDPATLPRREWLYGRHLVRRFISATIAPGGVGKSSLIFSEALAMVLGKPLLGTDLPADPLKVWIWNGEDPDEELQRRMTATIMHFGIDPADLDGRLFINSGRTTSIVLAKEQRREIRINEPDIQRLEATIRRHGIDVVIIDPFVSAHRVSENDNNKIDEICRALSGIADRTGCAIELVHHVRKTEAGREVTVDDARGAGALLGAVRSARVLNRMTQDEASAFDVKDPHLYFRVDNGKANLAPPARHAVWRRLVSVGLGNGTDNMIDDQDHIGVAVAWEHEETKPFVSREQVAEIQERVGGVGLYRADVRSKKWVGYPVAEVLELDTAEASVRANIKIVVAELIRGGDLVVIQQQDGKRMTKDFVIAGANNGDN